MKRASKACRISAPNWSNSARSALAKVPIDEDPATRSRITSATAHEAQRRQLQYIGFS